MKKYFETLTYRDLNKNQAGFCLLRLKISIKDQSTIKADEDQSVLVKMCLRIGS